MEPALTTNAAGLEVAVGFHPRAPVASGLVELQVRLVKPEGLELGSCRLVMAHGDGGESFFEKEIALDGPETLFWLAVNSHLLDNGDNPIRFTVFAPDGAELWSEQQILEVANVGELAEKVRASLEKFGSPLIGDGTCDSTFFDYQDESLTPWFDRPDAAEHVAAKYAAGEIDEAERDALLHFVESGYLILPESIEEELLRQIDAEVDEAAATHYQGYHHGSSQRLEKLHETRPGIRKLWTHPKIMHFLGLIFGVPARPCQTLLYIFGSQQDLHQDTIHLTPFPAGYMCGVWVALEDVQPDSGELEIVPGSHRLPRVYMAETGCDKKGFAAGEKREFEEKVVPVWDRLAKEHDLERVPYRPKRGTVLVWHENLMHGGSIRRDPTLSRRSLVTHNFAEGAIAYYDSLGTPGFRLALSELDSDPEPIDGGAAMPAMGAMPEMPAAVAAPAAPAAVASGQALAEINARLDGLSAMVAELTSKFQTFQDIYFESREDLWERSRARWRDDEDDNSLTWGVRWTGDAFIDLVCRNASFDETTKIIEIGPGYGRLLDTLLERGLPFASYLGIELSRERVARLRQKYAADPRIQFTCDDVETFQLEEPRDVCFSSSTMMHLFPNFDRALSNLRRNLKIGGVVCFDVTEGGSGGRFQDDGVTFGRTYSRPELRAAFDGNNFGKLFMDTVVHGADHKTGEPVEMLFVAVTRLS